MSGKRANIKEMRMAGLKGMREIKTMLKAGRQNMVKPFPNLKANQNRQ